MRILPPTLVLASMAVMVALRLAAPGPTIAVAPWNWLGLVAMGAGLGLAFRGSRLFARLGTNIRTFDEPTLLVTHGPFRWTRNPMYLGFVALLAGFGVALGAASPLALPLAFALIADRWYIPFEEAALKAKFGEGYAAYAARTRRWL